MKILGLRTCIYKVTDLNQAIEWYNKAFDTEPYFNEPFYVGYNIGGYELGLQPEESSSALRKSKNVYTYWGVDNIHKMHQHMIDLGATTDEAPNNVGGDLMVASVIDPWGNVIGLIYNPSFKLPSDSKE